MYSQKLGASFAAAACKRPVVPRLRGPVKVPSRSASYKYVRFGAPDPQHSSGGGWRGRRNPWDMWQNPNFRKTAYAAGGLSGAFYLYHLETVPVSGRKRFNVISVETEEMLAKQMYEQTLNEFQARILGPYHPKTLRVQRVMSRLVPVSGMERLNWEVFVVKDDSIKNAFVIPGGKVFVFSGILPICGDDEGLAAVLSHEISHTVAHHTSERLSKYLIVIAGILLISVAVGDVGPLGRMLLDLVYLRPGSRKQEAEADYIGLMMMAQACYNPEKAVGLWERMQREEQHTPPQFLSTHPSNEARVRNIKEWLLEAKQKQAASDCAGTLDYAEQFRKAFNYPNW